MCGEAGHLGISALPMEDGDTKLELNIQDVVVLVNKVMANK